MSVIKTIGFDADDTLWHNERFFGEAQNKLTALLHEYADNETVSKAVLEMQRQNVNSLGYGIKSFTFAMMQVALDLSREKLDSKTMREVINIGREMMEHPVDFIDGVPNILESLSESYELVLITKGDLIDQERKVNLSNVGRWFKNIEIVSEKHSSTYKNIFSRFGKMDESVMVGNSIKSIVGASWLTNEKNALVSDIGGTTTDVAVLAEGKPKIDPEGAMVGGLRTMVEAVAMRTFGLGGDSQVHLKRDGLIGELILGPRRVMPVSLLAADHKKIVHDALDSALNSNKINEFAGQFLVPISDNASELSNKDVIVFNRIKDGPIPMSEAISSRVDLGSISRLLERGIIMHSALTPSDASHVLGNLDAWDASAAQKALLIFGRMRTGSGEILSKDYQELALRIINQLTEQTSEVILETAFGEENIDGRARDLARHVLVKNGLNHHRNIVSLDVAINLPIIGLGASAKTYYGEVGKKLSTKTILPKHGGVANAIGAVVGQITMRESGKIVSGGEGIWRVFTDKGPVDCKDQKVAYEILKQGLTNKVQLAATNAGAENIHIQFEDEEQTAIIEGREVFIEGSILAIATGRPRIVQT